MLHTAGALDESRGERRNHPLKGLDGIPPTPPSRARLRLVAPDLSTGHSWPARGRRRPDEGIGTDRSPPGSPRGSPENMTGKSQGQRGEACRAQERARPLTRQTPKTPPGCPEGRPSISSLHTLPATDARHPPHETRLATHAREGGKQHPRSARPLPRGRLEERVGQTEKGKELKREARGGFFALFVQNCFRDQIICFVLMVVCSICVSEDGNGA